MKKSTLVTTGSGGMVDRSRDSQSVIAFGAPSNDNVCRRRRMGHIVVLPGGLVLIDEGLSEKLKNSLGTPISGSIECKDERE